MFRKGFTLIELLIVITIIAILSGAAIPYVQDYVDDARFARAKADLTEIRNALVRFETDRGTLYENTDISALVGPYIQKSMVDPWGAPYVVTPAASLVSSNGPDGTPAGGDDVTESYRPPLALTKAYWEDTVSNGLVDAGDSLILKFSRPVATGYDLVTADFVITGAVGVTLGANDWNVGRTQAKVAIAAVGTAFIPGKDTIVVTGTNIVDGTLVTPVACKPGLPMPIKAR